jgi:tetratricopeptide (TPR) repeat protein
MEDQEHPDDPFTLFNLGSVFLETGDATRALTCLKRSLQRSHVSDSIVRKLYVLMAQAHRRLGQKAEVLAACREGRSAYPLDVELLLAEGLALRELGDLQGAENRLLQLMNVREGAHFASVDPDLKEVKAPHNLAVIYCDQGRLAEAEATWCGIIDGHPQFLPGLVGLAEVYVKQKRWPEFDTLLKRIGADPKSGFEVATLSAQAALAQSRFGDARQTLTRLIAQAPQALLPRVLLSYAYLQEGNEWAAAEQALRNVLEIDPTNAEAKRNLEVLMTMLDRPTGDA